MQIEARDILANSKRVVIKVGTALVQPEILAALAGDVAALRDEGKDVTIISSGAIALGRRELGETRAKDAMSVAEKQAMASVGQPALMQMWKQALKPFGYTPAQLLLTKSDLKNGLKADIRETWRALQKSLFKRDIDEENPKANIKHTVSALHGREAVVIINENDTTVTEEIRFGDNDRLGAMVATKIAQADVYIILSDVGGLYSANPQKDPQARHIPVVGKIDKRIRAMADGVGSALSSGGMASKLLAAEIARKEGCATIICMGDVKGAQDQRLGPIAALRHGIGTHTVFLPEAALRRMDKATRASLSL